MTDTQAQQPTAEGNAQQFLIQRVYLKDLSFETPMGPKAFSSKAQPQVDQQLSTKTNKLDTDLYEAVLSLTITAKIDDDTAILVEVQQAGIFLIKGLEGPALTHALNTTCMQILFPYAREVIDSSLMKGTFPPILLPPVNFEALYAQALAEKQSASN